MPSRALTLAAVLLGIALAVLAIIASPPLQRDPRIASPAGATTLYVPIVGNLSFATDRAPGPTPRYERLPVVGSDGAAEDLLAARARPLLVVDLWATWCGPCRAEIDTLGELAERWAGDTRFVGLSTEGLDGRSLDPIELQKIDALGVRYPVAFASSETWEALRREYPDAGMTIPTKLWIAADGRLLAATVGAASEEVYSELRRVLLEVARDSNHIVPPGGARW